MSDSTLVIMAAGIGSRFGNGIKQLEPVGPGGEVIMDYSVYDAIKAGFNKVIFIIRKDLEKDFKEIIGDRLSRVINVDYVFQELDDLPGGYRKPEGRTKPWGTGQAILCCKGKIRGNFAVINADDYYGQECYIKLNDYMRHMRTKNGKYHFCMAGFKLGNTLSDNGAVTRGICKVDENKHLLWLDETKNIVKCQGGACVLRPDGTQKKLNLHSFVSMNMWGFTADFLDELEERFRQFLDENIDDMDSEFLIPCLVDELINEHRAVVNVLDTPDIWFGVTYKEDKETVAEAFQKLTEEGVYPPKLFCE